VTHQADHIDDELLSTLVDDQLTQDEKTLVQAHLASCLACQDRLEELRSVAVLLRRMPEAELPREFKLGPRVVADPPNVVRLRRWYAVVRTSAASLAAVFVLLSVGALYVDSRPGSTPTNQAPAPQVVSGPAAATQGAPSPEAPGVKAAVPAAAQQRASPASVGGAAAAHPAPDNQPQPDDQYAAATSVGPLPTLVPTPQPTAVQLLASPPVSGGAPDSVAPLRYAAAAVGLLAVATLLATLIVRHRLRRAASYL
jgi:anti-sigma factor RsiW